MNVITGLGGSRDKSTLATIGKVQLLTIPELDALYHGNDLPAKIVDKLPAEALRLGFQTGDQDVDDACQKWDAAGKLLEAWIWGRCYGGGAIYMGFSDRHGHQDQPVDLTKIGPGDLRFLQVLDRWELSVGEWEMNAASEYYGEPRTYRITPLTGGLTTLVGKPVHRSRMILFGGARTSMRWRRLNAGFDLSVLQRCQDILRDTDQSWRSIMLLVHDLSQAVFKVNGLVDMLAEGQKDTLVNRMEIVDIARSVARAVVVDKDGEDFEHVGAQNVTGIDPIMLRIFQRLAAAADMPLTVLLGMSPAGMNATGESDLRVWYASVEAERRQKAPLVRRLARVIARTEGLEPPEEITWPALYEATELELADIDQKKATTDQIRIQSQVIDPEEARRVIAGERLADVLADKGAEPGVEPVGSHQEFTIAPEAGDLETITIAKGQIWIDSRDEHRIRVNMTLGKVVYAVDLDGPTREQFAWTKASFLERCIPPVDLGPANP